MASSAVNLTGEAGGEMSLSIMTINSVVLEKDMNIAVYCPNGYENTALPVLYFLHGRSGNESLLEQLGMDKLSDRLIDIGAIKPMIIACPNMDNSRGINSSATYYEITGKYGAVHKGRYEDYLLHEVIPYIERRFCADQSRGGRFIGGISSGGYCALSIGLRHSDLFSKIGGHMPAIDLSYEDEDEAYFADKAMWLRYDPVAIAEKGIFHKINVYLDDGKDDEGQFYRACEKLTAVLKSQGADVQFYLFDGHHDQNYVLSHLHQYLLFYGGNQ